ncbi:hypothetical protein DOTSEDRAFT_87825 [Dothistroma septosporum NZE10]|uniref:Uncharacterized protein n=1 Tax=Dothistroma septosporum (strain NZE10 / CBS 128990) TaxID=675120 RepID=N1PQ13_DOTSN|nr:hypothetical protein DOTSEDRAFT_87825 [Dothistroma septosporum NZE10]
MERRITSSPDRALPTLREMFKAHVSTFRPHSSTKSSRQHQQQQLQRQQPRGTQHHHPHLFEYPHQQATTQATEPFWHQHPYWTQHQLHYYPELGSYFDQPLYTTETINQQPVVIGYGNGSKFREFHQQNRNASEPLARNQTTGPKVDVFSGDELIRSIPLRILTRFSDAGRRSFTGPEQPRATQPTFSKNTSTLSPSKVDSISDWADNVNEATEASIAAGPGTNMSHSARQNPHSSKQDTVAAPRSLAFAKPCIQKRTLQLKLDVVEMPSKSALLSAIKWMEDNELSDKSLIDYAPSQLENIRLDDLIDLYQAALAFELRPWGKAMRVEKEICNRVSRGRLEISAFKRLSRWLPANDTVIARCINTMEHYREKRAYSDAEIEEVTTFLQQRGNEPLDDAFTKIIDQWRVRREARGRRQRRERVRSNAAGAKNGGFTERVGVTKETEAKQAIDNDEHPTPRRRNRRAQKAKGKAKKGAGVPGASS